MIFVLFISTHLVFLIVRTSLGGGSSGGSGGLGEPVVGLVVGGLTFKINFWAFRRKWVLGKKAQHGDLNRRRPGWLGT